MRMWMVDPKKMCRKHLLGEHVELHILASLLLKGRSIQGFLDKFLLEPQNLYGRHEALVEEMETRGYNHKSLLPHVPLQDRPIGQVFVSQSEAELVRRCKECRERR